MGSSQNPKTTVKAGLSGLHHIFAGGLKQDSSTYYSTSCSWGCSRTISVCFGIVLLAVTTSIDQLLGRTG